MLHELADEVSIVQLRQEACYSHVAATLSSLHGVAASSSDSIASLSTTERQAGRRQLLQVPPAGPACKVLCRVLAVADLGHTAESQAFQQRQPASAGVELTRAAFCKRLCSAARCMQAVEAAEDTSLHDAVFTALAGLDARAELLQLSCSGLEAFLRRSAGLPTGSTESPSGVPPMDAQAVRLLLLRLVELEHVARLCFQLHALLQLAGFEVHAKLHSRPCSSPAVTCS